MRKWINIVETHDDDDDEFWRQYDAENEPDSEFVREVRSTLEEHGGEADVDEIESVEASIRERMSSGAIIYRVMRLPISWADQLLAGGSLGQSWSLSEDCPIDNLYDKRDHPDGHLFRFTATADLWDIELEHSVAFQILFPEEDEVFIGRNGSVTLHQIDCLDTHELDIRPDLRGKSFTS